MIKSFKHRLALMNTLCRVCGREEKNCISVFSENGKKQKIEKKIRLCLPLIIEELDTLPKQICLTCLHKLDATWELFQLCKNGQVLIEEKLHSITVNETREEVNTTCSKCDLEVLDQQFGIACDGQCRRWYHHSCVNLSDAEYFEFVQNQSKIWICPNCKFLSYKPTFPTKQILFNDPKLIDEKVQLLTEDRPITIGDSAIITLVPVSEPQLLEVQAPAVSSEAVVGIMPTYQVPAPVPTVTPSASTTTATAPDNHTVYPQGLIQVLPSNKPVLYQPQDEVVKPSPQQSFKTNKRSVPAPKIEQVEQKPCPLSRKRPPISRHVVKDGNFGTVPSPKRMLALCKYCKKSFSDDIIDHHVSLHLRQSFFTCIDCNKNFRSELAMSRHRCETVSTNFKDTTINLDPDDDS